MTLRTSDSFPIIRCSDLIIKPVTTKFKWQFINKNPKVFINRDKDVARTTSQSGFNGVRSNRSFLIGNDEKSWVYGIINTGCIYVGMVNSTHDFNSLGASIEQKIEVVEFDRLIFNLSVNVLTIIHKNESGVIKQYSFPLTPLTGQTLWPWVSSSPGFRLGVWLYENVQTSIKLNEDGKLIMNTKNVDIGDIGIADSCIEFKGPVNTNKITVLPEQTNALEIRDNQNAYLKINTSAKQVEVGVAFNAGFNDITTMGTTTTRGLTTNMITSIGNTDVNILPDGSGEVILKADPVSNLGAATKQYVDLLAKGLDPKESVRVATNSLLPAYTRSGLTLTAGVNGSLNDFGVDSITNMVIGDRLLINNAGVADPADAGIYELIELGDVSSSWVMTRSTDADDGKKLSAASYVFVEEGAMCGDSGWVMTTDNPIVIGTTPINWVKFSQAGVIVAENVGSGIGEIFRDKIDTKLNFKTLSSGSSKLTISNNTDDIAIDVEQSQITGTGALDAGSITSNFGDIDVGTSNISSAGAISAGLLNVGNILLDNNVLSSTNTNGDVSILPNGVGEVLLKADPVSKLGAATKKYVGLEDNKIREELSRIYQFDSAELSPMTEFSNSQLISGQAAYLPNAFAIVTTGGLNPAQKSIWTADRIIDNLENTNYIIEFQNNGARLSNMYVGLRSDVDTDTRSKSVLNAINTTKFPGFTGIEVRQKDFNANLTHGIIINGTTEVNNKITNLSSSIGFIRFVIVSGYLYVFAKNTNTSDWFNWNTSNNAINNTFLGEAKPSYKLDTTQSFYVGVYDSTSGNNSDVRVFPRILRISNEIKTSMELQTLEQKVSNNRIAIAWSALANIGSTSPDQWLIPFHNETTAGNMSWGGRFYFPTNINLTEIVIIGDTETHNTLLTGFYTLEIYKENLINGGTGSLIFTTNIHGRNSVNTPKFAVINSGNDPDNASSGSANVFFTVPVDVSVSAGEAISIKVSNFATVDGIGMETKYFTYYNIN